MIKAIKKWKVKYDHKDGRSGEVDVITKIFYSRAFDYGNQKGGELIINGVMQSYDLRYNKESDLHMVMIQDYFGNGLVEVKEVHNELREIFN